jgi:hypothetical protein
MLLSACGTKYTSRDFRLLLVRNLIEEVWEVAVAVDSPSLHTWDTIGCLHQRQEKPYFTESSVDCVQKVCRIRMGHIAVHMNTSMADCLLWRVLSRKQLIWDLRLLLIGLPSQTFQYNQVWCKETVSHNCVPTRFLFTFAQGLWKFFAW